MKHIEAVNLLKGLMLLKGLKGLQLNHMIEQNVDRLNKEMDFLKKQENEIFKIYEPYEKERVALNERYATVAGQVKTKMQIGQDGKPQQVFDIPKEKEIEFETELAALAEKHSAIIKEHDDKQAEFKKFLETDDSKFVRMGIPMKLLPEDISIEYFRALKPLINDLETGPADTEG